MSSGHDDPGAIQESNVAERGSCSEVFYDDRLHVERKSGTSEGKGCVQLWKECTGKSLASVRNHVLSQHDICQQSFKIIAMSIMLIRHAPCYPRLIDCPPSQWAVWMNCRRNLMVFS